MDVLAITLATVTPWVALGVSVVSLAFSVHLARRSTHVTTYRNATDLALEIDRVFVASPDLRRFFFEGEPAGRATVETQRHVAAAAEFILDCLECIWDLRATYSPGDRRSWRLFVWDMVAGSPPLAQLYWKHQHQGWYPALDDLRAQARRKDARTTGGWGEPESGRPPDETVRFVPLDEAPTPLVRAFYDDLLVPQFPADELESFETLVRSIGARTDGVLALDGDRVVGGIVAEAFDPAGVQLISYLVVDPGARGHRLGTRLVERCVAASRFRLIVGEIEDPRYWGTTATSDPAARLRFWQRTGCRVLPLRYVQPRLGAGQDRVRNMLLIAVPGPGHEPEAAVPGRLVRAFLGEYYHESEGGEPDDAEYRALIESCTVDSLTLWPLDRLDEAVPGD